MGRLPWRLTRMLYSSATCRVERLSFIASNAFNRQFLQNSPKFSFNFPSDRLNLQCRIIWVYLIYMEKEYSVLKNRSESVWFRSVFLLWYEKNKESFNHFKCITLYYIFVLRYPQGKQEITGTCYETWHYRYVGVDVAREIYERGMCLEEYFD